jgi:DNA-binding LytR/AlgR family response regulator
VIADDEAGARAHLRALLETSRVHVVGECASGREVFSMVQAARPDLVCLDVRMPDLDGIAVARALRLGPSVVFTSGYAEHAAAAFEIGAADYLLKPLSASRLQEAIRRVHLALRQARPATGGHLGRGTNGQRSARQGAAMGAAAATWAQAASGRVARIFLPVEDHRIALSPEVIRFIEAQGGVCVVHTDDVAYRLRTPLGRLERLLSGYGFLRTHRAYLVNLRRVRALVTWSRHAHSLLLDAGQETHVPVAKSRLAAFRGSVIWIPHAGGQRSGPGAGRESRDRRGREPGVGPRHRGGIGR